MYLHRICQIDVAYIFLKMFKTLRLLDGTNHGELVVFLQKNLFTIELIQNLCQSCILLKKKLSRKK